MRTMTGLLFTGDERRGEDAPGLFELHPANVALYIYCVHRLVRKLQNSVDLDLFLWRLVTGLALILALLALLLGVQVSVQKL